MALRRYAREHADELVAVGLAGLYAVELANRGHGTDLSGALPFALLACASLSQRRRFPVPSYVVTIAANAVVPHWSPGFDANSISFVVVFLFALYSLGRHARGTAAWVAVGCVALSVVGFAVGDGAFRPSDLFFDTAFVSLPYAAGLTWRLRAERASSSPTTSTSPNPATGNST